MCSDLRTVKRRHVQQPEEEEEEQRARAGEEGKSCGRHRLVPRGPSLYLPPQPLALPPPPAPSTSTPFGPACSGASVHWLPLWPTALDKLVNRAVWRGQQSLNCSRRQSAKGAHLPPSLPPSFPLTALLHLLSLTPPRLRSPCKFALIGIQLSLLEREGESERGWGLRRNGKEYCAKNKVHLFFFFFLSWMRFCRLWWEIEWKMVATENGFGAVIEKMLRLVFV